MLTIQASQHGGHPSLALAGDLTIYTVAQARKDLNQRLAGDAVLELNLSGLEALDTAGVQLLVWLKRTAAAHGGTLTLAHHSAAVVEVLDLLKVTAELGDPILLSPSTH